MSPSNTIPDQPAGLAFVSGSPESLADKTSADPNTVTAIRRCALNATGLVRGLSSLGFLLLE